MKIEIFLFLGLALQALAKPTLHFTNGQKQSFKPQALPADPDDFSADDVVDAIEDGQTYLDKLKELCETVEEVADDINLEQVANVAVKSLKIIKKLGFYGDLVVSLIELFTGSVTDSKRSEISNIQKGMVALQDRMLNEFSNVHKAMASIDCKGRLSEYKNVIQTAFSQMVLYANEPNPALKSIHKQTLKEGLFQLKAAVNYMIASVQSHSTSDLSACPILDIIEKGDESTDFLQSSDAAIFTMANVMMNEIIFGTTVVGMIYNIQYGNVSASAMIDKEYNVTLVKAHNATL